MSKQRSLLLKKLTKTLAVTVPALALSGFVPIISSALVSSAHAEHHAEAKHAEASSEAEAKGAHSEAEAEAKKAKPEAESEAKKAKPEAESEAKK